MRTAPDPSEVDGHPIAILCRPCHRSKTKYGACAIDHAGALMESLNQYNQEDIDILASKKSEGMKGGRGRLPAELLVALSTRVDPETKRRLEARSNGGAISLGTVIKQLIDEVDALGMQRHREVMDALARIEGKIDRPVQVPGDGPVPDPTPAHQPTKKAGWWSR
jgi:hypothetical protein